MEFSYSSWCRGSDIIVFEAEDGVWTAPMTMAMDPEACKGAFIYTPEVAYTYTNAHEAGAAEFAFTVAGGDDVIWARAAAKGLISGSHNSFFVSVDGGAEDVWDLFEDTGGEPISFWTYDQISLRCGGDSETHFCKPLVISLHVGTHTLTLSGRESLTLLDKINLTSDLAYVPRSEASLMASVTVGWTPPDTNEDDTQLNNLGGYKVYYGFNSRNYNITNDVGLASTVTISNLEPHRVYFFATTAYSHQGNERTHSQELLLATDDDIDLDGDGISNRSEYLAGTDPNNGSSRQELHIQREGNHIQVSTVISPALGFVYFEKERFIRIDRCTDLLLDLWESVPASETLCATGQPMMVAEAEKPSCAFRTVIWLQLKSPSGALSQHRSS